MTAKPWQHPSASLRAGVARRDISPPIGMYNRMWGAATHDKCEGIHRPIVVTALALVPADQAPLLLVNLDWCVVHEAGVLNRLRDALLPMVGNDPARLIVSCTHTHGVGLLTPDRFELPGGDLMPGYVDASCQAIADAAGEAVAAANRACTLTIATGACSLAADRDMLDPDPARDRYLTGYNPEKEGAADTTLLVGRVTDDATGEMVATVVNYACHPTTLAWENRLASPDFVGAMRELVESHTGGAPCLFLQGASGELAPRYQYVGDPAVADQHGRQLGFSTLAALTSLLPGRQRLGYQRCVESGAPLGIWKPEQFEPGTEAAAERFTVEHPLRPLPTESELLARIEAEPDRAMSERLRRRLRAVRTLGGATTSTADVTIWRLGDILFLAQPGECYSRFQSDLRAAFPDLAVVVMNVANGWEGYLPPADLYDKDIYQVWQTPLAAGCLEHLTTTSITHLRALKKSV